MDWLYEAVIRYLQVRPSPASPSHCPARDRATGPRRGRSRVSSTMRPVPKRGCTAVLAMRPSRARRPASHVPAETGRCDMWRVASTSSLPQAAHPLEAARSNPQPGVALLGSRLACTVQHSSVSQGPSGARCS